MITYAIDSLLRLLQRTCKHPSIMVAADILEGDGYVSSIEVKYCRRCGAVKVIRDGRDKSIDLQWRLPDPHLWRCGGAR